jgi:osmotically-inducible protein OsmY
MNDRYRRNQRDWRDEDRHSQSYQQDDQRSQAGEPWGNDDSYYQSSRGSSRRAPMQQSYGGGRQGGDQGRSWQENDEWRGRASFGRGGGMPAQPYAENRTFETGAHQDRYGGWSGGQQEAFSSYEENRGDLYGQGYGASRSRDRSSAYGGGRGYGRDDDHDRGFLERAGDEVMSWFGDEDAARRREQDHRGRGPSDYKRSDERIREDANDRLTDDPRIDATHIRVKAQDGEITLDGTVDSRDAKRRAEDCVERISGVRHVQNNLRVAERSWSGTSGGGMSGGTTAGMGTTGSTTTGSTTTGSTTARGTGSPQA